MQAAEQTNKKNQIMTTLEKNRLLAVFMGKLPKLVAPHVYFYEDPYLSIQNNTPEKVMQSIVAYSEYHQNWSWIMPVVEKIGSLNQEVSTCITEGQPYCTIKCYSDDGSLDHEIEGEGSTPIETVYEACVQFVEWYNKKDI